VDDERSGGGTGPIWLENVRCAQDEMERTISECWHNGWGNTWSNHSDDVWIVCDGLRSGYNGLTYNQLNLFYRLFLDNDVIDLNARGTNEYVYTSQTQINLRPYARLHSGQTQMRM